MRAHVIVAAFFALVVLVLYGVADRTDRGVDTGKLWKEAHKRAKEVVK